MPKRLRRSLAPTLIVMALVAILPKQGDLLDVINTWNESHPAEPLTSGERHPER